MRISKVLVYGMLLAGLTTPLPALADQQQDWMLVAQRPGTYLNLDVIFGALQAGLERRMNLFGGANQLTLRASALAAIPYGNAQVDADMRVVILNLGISAGAQDFWINQTFGPNEPLHRKQRRAREAGGDFDTQQHGFFEGRAGLVLPFNDYVVFNNINAYRVTGMRDRTWDYQTGVVHDGNYLRSDFQLFFKHRDFGGLAPMIQLLNFPLTHGGESGRHTQVNFGFVFLSRAGLVARNDLVLFQMMFHAGDALGGYDNSEVYGMAVLRGPASFTLVYRSVITL